MALRMFRAAALVSAILAACSSFSSSNDSVESDAGADAVSGDDAAPDAPPLDDAGLAWVPCTQREGGPAHFCADFDSIDNVMFGWTRQTISMSATVGLTDQAPLSPPKAYAASFPAGNVGLGRAFVERTHPPALLVSAANAMKLSFAMRIDKSPYAAGGGVGSYMHFAVLTFDDPSCPTDGKTQHLRDLEIGIRPSGAVALEIKGLGRGCPDGGTAINDYDSIVSTIPAPTLADGKFHTWQLIVKRNESCPLADAGAATVSLVVDGTASPCGMLTLDPFDNASTKLDLAVGPQTGGDWGDTHVTFDNLTFDVE